MTGLGTIGRLTAMLGLGVALSGCIDADVDVALTSETTARVTMTQVMGAEFYSMLKLSNEEASEDTAADDEFCAEGDLTEAKDGSATCVTVEEGPFAGLTASDGEQALSFTAAGPGLVRISLPTDEMKAEIGAEEEMDAETRQMVQAFFAGHAITVRFSGAEVSDTNMTLSDDKRSAEQVIDFIDLINGTLDLPEELYAVVRAP
jgi:hypothetical protein